MITAGNVYPTPPFPYGAPYPCDGSNDCGGGGPRFGPAAADAYGPGAWPTYNGYGSPSVLFSVPIADTRPPFVFAGAAPDGPVVNAGYRGGPSNGYPAVSGAPSAAGSLGYAAPSCRALVFPGFPRWSDGTVSGPQSAPAPGGADAALSGDDVFKGLLWVGVGLVAYKFLLAPSRGRRG